MTYYAASYFFEVGAWRLDGLGEPQGCPLGRGE